MTANRERERESEVEQGLHQVAVWLQTSTGQQCQSRQAFPGCSPRRRDTAVMHSGVQDGRRGGAGRASGRGAAQGTAKRSQSLLCCSGSAEKHSPLKLSLRRYVPAREPVLPVWHTGGFEYHHGYRLPSAESFCVDGCVNGLLYLCVFMFPRGLILETRSQWFFKSFCKSFFLFFWKIFSCQLTHWWQIWPLLTKAFFGFAR